MKLLRHTLVFLVFVPLFVAAHHNPVVYDGKRTVTLTGVVKAARFGFPHSRYRIEVTNDAGEAESWTLMTEDPRDAKALGFDDELKAIAVGDSITVVGWPNKIKAREIRGHQLHYPDGTVVMMRRGNYIWTADLRRIWRLRDRQIEFPDNMVSVPDDAEAADRVRAWIDEGQPVARVAAEIVAGRAGLIGIDDGSGPTFAGVREPFRCHTERDDFRIEIDVSALPASDADALAAGADYVREYNDLMATYWEYDIVSCP